MLKCNKAQNEKITTAVSNLGYAVSGGVAALALSLLVHDGKIMYDNIFIVFTTLLFALLLYLATTVFLIYRARDSRKDSNV